MYVYMHTHSPICLQSNCSFFVVQKNLVSEGALVIVAANLRRSCGAPSPVSPGGVFGITLPC